MRLSRRAEPFDSEDYIFELKIDGFRSLAYIEHGQCDLVSRNGNTFRNFKDLGQCIGENLRLENAVIDAEIACVDDLGRSVFNDLMFRRRVCVFFAFDLLFLNGEDLRGLPLIEREMRLKNFCAGNARVCSTSIMSRRMVVICSRKCADSILKASLRSGRRLSIGLQRSRRRIGSRLRIRTTAFYKSRKPKVSLNRSIRGADRIRTDA